MRVGRATSSRNESCPVSGVHHIVTGPTSAASAVVTARSVRRSCSAAAACAPIVEMRRVLASPGTGAFAMIAIDTALLLLDGGIAVAPCELSRISTKKVRKPQAPHQKYCAERPMVLPAPRGRGDTRANAKRSADALESDRECNVFHQCDGRETADGIERRACDEKGLIAGRDPGQARTQIHHESDETEQAATIE